MHIEALKLQQVLVFLVAAGLVVPLISRLRVSPVLGFLVVGLVIGPYGLARFTEMLPWLRHAVIGDVEGVRALAELGVVFLLFMIGLELSLPRLWSMRRLVFGLGGAQVVVTGIVIGAIAACFDNTLAAVIVLGACFALSSTAIVVQLLSESRRLGTSTGRVSFAILLMQDLAVLPILFLVSALAAQKGGSTVLAFLWAMTQAGLAVAAILLLGRLVIRPLFRMVGKTASREMLLALVLLVIIGTAVGTSQIGLSMALGAFLAGLLFAETEYRHAIEVDIEPFKGLLLGLFFVSVGMGLDITEVIREPFWIAASVAGLVLVKGAILYALTRLFGEPRSVAAESALLLAQGGEFAFLIVGLAHSLAILPTRTSQFMLVVTGLSMLATPLLATLARRLGSRLETAESPGDTLNAGLPGDLSGHVIVAGYGRVGQLLGSVLDGHGLLHVALDNDMRLVARFREQRACTFFGDASHPDMLEKLGAGRAAALVVTMDSPQAAERVVAAARRQWPALAIVARARDPGHARRLIALGATSVVPETTEASLQLVERVLTGVGVPVDAARQIIDVRRDREEAEVAGPL
ncbi:MAG: cation:proton antiporter [Hyphomicrobiaceae bacterium]